MLRKGFSHASVTLYHLTVDFIRLLGSFLQSRSSTKSAKCDLTGSPMQPGFR